MIERQAAAHGKVKVTFRMPTDDVLGTVSVVGDFNGWEPGATVLHKRGAARSASVSLDPGRYAFRYLATDGQWLDDDAADAYEPNEFGVPNCIIDLARS